MSDQQGAANASDATNTVGADQSTTRSDTESAFSAPQRCAICGATSNLQLYQFTATEYSDRPPIYLCETHYLIAQLAAGQSLTEAEMNDPSADTAKITIRVPRALKDSVDQLAEQHGLTRSEAIRKAIHVSLELEYAEDGLEDILVQATDASTNDETTADDDAVDVAFLKERIRTLESLLDQTIEKI